MKEYRGCYLKIRGNIFVMGGAEYAFTVAATGQKTSLIAERDMEENTTVEVIGSMQKNASHGSADGVAPTLTGAMGMGGGQIPMVKEIGNLYKGQAAWESQQYGRVYDEEEISPTILDYSHGGGLQPKVPIKGKKYRIRKLTERECFRLMDVDEADIDTIQGAGISRTQQYKMAGNSIVVSCLYHLFRKMFVETENEERQLTLF